MSRSLWKNTPHLPAPLDEQSDARIIHVAGAVDENDVLQGKALLQSHGISVQYDPNANAPDHYLAATDAQRLQDLERGRKNPQVRALLCARGGYGSMRLLDALPPIEDPQHFPWLVGYSDITALHLWANAQGVATIHGPLVSGFARYGDKESEELSQLVQCLKGHATPHFSGLKTIHSGHAKGRLIGGNLSLIQAMIGTRWLPHFDGALLLVEEIGEPAYRIDRMLQSLALSGRAKGLRGIIFGDLSQCRGLDERTTPELLQRWTQDFDCPVVMGLPCGHDQRNLPIILGLDYTLDAKEGTLTPHPSAAQTRNPIAHKSSPEVRATTDSENPMGAGYFPTTSVATSRLQQALASMLDQGVCTALQLVVSCEGQRTHAIAMGTTAVLPDATAAPVLPHTRFDLASVSKAVSTAILAHQLIDEGRVDLQQIIPPHISQSGATLEHLLAHRSGLPAWLRLYDQARRQENSEAWLRQRFQELTAVRPPNTACVYSDPGYILLGWWLEDLTQESLAQLFQKRIAQPLQLSATSYQSTANAVGEPARFAATEWCPWRQSTLQGVVHDEHAQIFRGIAGHAGIFAPALEVDRIAQSLLSNDNAILSREGTARMWSKPDPLCDGGYTLGWDTPTAIPSNAGSLMTPGACVGHLGYAGTSLWIDQEKKLSITLLTNRVHPSRDAQGIRQFRPRIHDLVVRELFPSMSIE